MLSDLPLQMMSYEHHTSSQDHAWPGGSERDEWSVGQVGLAFANRRPTTQFLRINPTCPIRPISDGPSSDFLVGFNGAAKAG